MNVQIRLFATFRQYLPPGTQGSACDVEAPPGARAGDLLSRFGVPMDNPDVMVILVNGRHSDPDQVLEEGDVLGAFPAIAGG